MQIKKILDLVKKHKIKNVDIFPPKGKQFSLGVNTNDLTRQHNFLIEDIQKIGYTIKGIKIKNKIIARSTRTMQMQIIFLKDMLIFQEEKKLTTDDEIPWGEIFLLKDVEQEVWLDALMYGLARVVGRRLVYLTEEEKHDDVKIKRGVKNENKK